MNAQVRLAISQETNIHSDTRSVTAFGSNATLIRTRATEFLEHRLNYLQNNVDDFLFELAGKTLNEDLNYLYLDTVSRLRNKRDALKKTFFANFEQLCQDSTYSTTTQPPSTADSAAIDKLLRSGNDDLEAVIAIKNIAEKYQRLYTNELTALRSAIPAPQHQALSSVSPQLLCIAWKQLVDTLKLTVKAKFVVYKVFSKFILDELTPLYHGLLAEVGHHIPGAQLDTISADIKGQPEISDMPLVSSTPANGEDSNKGAPIEKKLLGRKLPNAVHQFLFTVWSDVLVQVKIQKGTDSSAWSGAMQVIDDLAAVTQLKHAPQHSARLLEIIPRLLCNLQNGLGLITYEKQKKEQLFNQLLTLHAHAIQSRKSRLT